MGELIVHATLLLFTPCPEGDIVAVAPLMPPTWSTKSTVVAALFTVVLGGGVISTVPAELSNDVIVAV